MVYTVTMNPSLDYIMYIDKLNDIFFKEKEELEEKNNHKKKSKGPIIFIFILILIGVTGFL